MEDLQRWFLYDFDIGQKKLNPVIIITIIIIIIIINIIITSQLFT